MQVVTTQKQRSERLNTCAACEWKIIKLGLDVCGKCNCPLGGKTILVDAKCPANKWPILRLYPLKRS